MDDLGPFRPKLRMFMSVDIVGSTVFKQSAKNQAATDTKVPAEAWFSPIVRFYQKMEAFLLEEWEDYKKNIQRISFTSWTRSRNMEMRWR